MKEEEEEKAQNISSLSKSLKWHGAVSFVFEYVIAVRIIYFKRKIIS